MPETWTGELIGRMHNARVSLEDIAKEMCCTKAYVSMILNGSRNPPNARQRLEAAFENIVSHRLNDAV